MCVYIRMCVCMHVCNLGKYKIMILLLFIRKYKNANSRNGKLETYPWKEQKDLNYPELFEIAPLNDGLSFPSQFLSSACKYLTI